MDKSAILKILERLQQGAGRDASGIPQDTQQNRQQDRQMNRQVDGRRRQSTLLPMLHAVQEEAGYVPDAAIPLIAEALNISHAEVLGVISFYHDFRRTAPGKHVLKVCRAEACQAMGCEGLVKHLESSIGIGIGVGIGASGHQTTSDHALTIEPVYCLGNCALSPAMMLDGKPQGGMTVAKLDSLLASLVDSLPESTGDRPERNASADSDATEHPARATSSAPVRIYIPCDSAALSAGADEVAKAVEREIARRGLDAQVVRNGSRGMFWLEPLMEVETRQAAGEGTRVAYGPVAVPKVAELFDAGFLDHAAMAQRHPLYRGVTEQIPYLARQTRLTFARCGVTDPLSLKDYAAHGGFRGLRKALAISAQAVIDEVKRAGLRGRGGAGFPTGVKWQTVADATAEQKYIVCNADEGDSGTFADRMIMEGDPFVLLEGMLIAGIAVGASEGFIYCRSEYPHAFRTLQQAVAIAREHGYLGNDICGSSKAFEIEVRLGAGAYICGEETSLLESLEGKRGQVRPKPPLPAIHGLFSQPTVVNNVISLATVPVILDRGGEYYRDFGVGQSRGTLTIQLAGNVKQGGLVETAFGMTLRQAIDEFGGGTASGRPVRAVQVGGPLGAYFPASLLDTPLDYEAFAHAKGMLGHGGIVVFDDTVDLAKQARFAMEFCAIESCGKCTPCRLGSTRGVEVIDRIIAGENRAGNLALLEDLCELMVDGSLCALGGLTPYPVRSALRHFPEDFAKPAANANGKAQEEHVWR
jgi:formate dehydrogenase iron-sulfur subunit